MRKELRPWASLSARVCSTRRSTRLPRGATGEGWRATPARSGSSPAGYDFDIAVFRVADPAAEVELAGFAMDEPAEANALYAATDEEVKNHV